MNPFTYDLQPTSWSRNWDDEVYDNEAPNNFIPNLEWKIAPSSSPLQTKTLIVGFRGSSAAFLHSYFPQKKVIAIFSLSESSKKHGNEQGINDKNCFVYSVESSLESMILVICQYDIPADKAYEWTQVLFQNFQPQRVVVLDRILDIEYKILNNEMELEPPLLKRIENSFQSKSSSPNFCSFLETPNLIDKGPAALISFCEYKCIPASLFITLEPAQVTPLESLAAFEPVISHFSNSFSPPSQLQNRYKEIITRIAQGRSNPLFL